MKLLAILLTNIVAILGVVGLYSMITAQGIISDGHLIGFSFFVLGDLVLLGLMNFLLLEPRESRE